MNAVDAQVVPSAPERPSTTKASTYAPPEIVWEEPLVAFTLSEPTCQPGDPPPCP